MILTLDEKRRRHEAAKRQRNDDMRRRFVTNLQEEFSRLQSYALKTAADPNAKPDKTLLALESIHLQSKPTRDHHIHRFLSLAKQTLAEVSGDHEKKFTQFQIQKLTDQTNAIRRLMQTLGTSKDSDRVP